ncbi:hypothetical protein C8R44DRAFT_780331 [Mycena epipterygia]|nr:hypothetical protein C8R44DRAFT_780331 [Mycena epipterygia]
MLEEETANQLSARTVAVTAFTNTLNSNHAVVMGRLDDMDARLSMRLENATASFGPLRARAHQVRLFPTCFLGGVWGVVYLLRMSVILNVFYLLKMSIILACSVSWNLYLFMATLRDTAFTRISHLFEARQSPRDRIPSLSGC